MWLQILLSITSIEKDGNEPSATAAKERSEQGYEVLSLYASDVNCSESGQSLSYVEGRISKENETHGVCCHDIWLWEVRFQRHRSNIDGLRSREKSWVGL